MQASAGQPDTGRRIKMLPNPNKVTSNDLLIPIRDVLKRAGPCEAGRGKFGVQDSAEGIPSGRVQGSK